MIINKVFYYCDICGNEIAHYDACSVPRDWVTIPVTNKLQLTKHLCPICKNTVVKSLTPTELRLAIAILDAQPKACGPL